MEISETNS